MRKVLFAVLLGGTMATGAYAQTELRTASGFGPNHVNAKGYVVFLEKLKELTGGEFTGRDFPAGLAAPPEMVDALKSGIVDVGSVLMPYFPAEFHDAGLPSEMALTGKNGLVMSAASTEYLVTCAACLGEFTKLGEIFLAGAATPPYDILSTVPVRDVPDMKGLRIRTGGSAFTRWAVAMGASPIQLPAPEIFQALSQGVVQAHYNNPQDMQSYNLFDIIKSITQINLGTFNGVSPFSMRMSLWQKLSPENRKAFVMAAQYGAAEIMFKFNEQAAAALEKARVGGVEIIEPTDAFQKANAAFVKSDTAALPALLEGKGIKSADEKVKRFEALVEKWTSLVKDVKTQEDYYKVLMSEIWSKVDYSKYPG
jgi:TRAP-type transport system periplasmic protein